MKLVSGLRNDDLEAFGILYNRYKKVVYCLAIRFLFDPEESKEVVQNVFINLWEHRIFLDEEKSVKSYIYRSAVNNIYNLLKKKAVRRKFVVAELRKPESFSNPYDQIFYKDLDEKIRWVIKSLPPQQQKIFILHLSDGLPSEEIAVQLNLSVRTVENQIYRVNKILRNSFRSEFHS